jgi:hypothetical protein
MTRSQILMSEGVENTERKFGSANRYYPAYVNRAGRWEPALFTRGELLDAIDRATVNPEDVPPRAHWIARLRGWLTGKL